MKPYYQDSAVTIYHGDYRDVLRSVLPKVDIGFVDPPYNVALGTKSHAKRQLGYENSLDNIDDYDMAMTELWRFMNGSCRTFFVTPGNSNQTMWPPPLWTMAWTKTNGVARTPLTLGQKMNHACWEPILVYGKLDKPPHSDVLNLPISIQPECDAHPCPKPLKLLLQLIAMKDGEVLDPMMGSGTTLRAAKELCRKAIGIEIEERYCEIAAKRMEQEVFNFTPAPQPIIEQPELV